MNFFALRKHLLTGESARCHRHISRFSHRREEKRTEQRLARVYSGQRRQEVHGRPLVVSPIGERPTERHCRGVRRLRNARRSRQAATTHLRHSGKHSGNARYLISFPSRATISLISILGAKRFKLLEQLLPQMYVQLEDRVVELAITCRQRKDIPVVVHHDFK